MREQSQKALVELVDRYYLGTISDAEFGLLQDWLRESAEARAQFAWLGNWDANLRSVVLAGNRNRSGSSSRVLLIVDSWVLPCVLAVAMIGAAAISLWHQFDHSKSNTPVLSNSISIPASRELDDDTEQADRMKVSSAVDTPTDSMGSSEVSFQKAY